MASLSQAKTLGGVGGILALLFWLPAHVGVVFLIVGLVLMLFAVKNIADTVGDEAIFSNMIYSVVLAIIGPIIATGSCSPLRRHSSVLSAVSHQEQ